MIYKLTYTKRFEKEFDKLDNYTRQMVANWIKKHLLNIDNPRYIGKALLGNRKGEWRYRIGDYRLICVIQDSELVIVALSIGHRKEVYKK